jgi:diacylglycerol kinase family enzyme
MGIRTTTEIDGGESPLLAQPLDPTIPSSTAPLLIASKTAGPGGHRPHRVMPRPCGHGGLTRGGDESPVQEEVPMLSLAQAGNRLPPRWMARLALAAGATGMLLLLVFAGFRSVPLVAVGLAGLVVTAAGAWWALAHTGPVRLIAVALGVAAPLAVVILYVLADLLWVVLVSLALWGLAVSAGRIALAGAMGGAGVPEHRVTAPQRPFLIMNPRSGNGKVRRFHLAEKAREAGAEVVLLDPAHPQDVAGLARRAVDDGADLLGVAGGDGTQALVAGVAAERGVPFMVITAGTRNHFALDLGLDREDPSACLEALTDGVELRIDLGRIGVGPPGDEGTGRVFVNNASFGAYAAVVQSPAYRDDKVGTTLQLLPDLLTHHTGPHMSVQVDGVVVDRPQALLVSNNPYRTDDPAGLGRRERLDGGLLGVLAVKVDNAVQAAGMLRGKRAQGLTSLTAEMITVRADSDAIPVGVDGEALTLATPVTCWIDPRALRVRVPRRRPGVPPARPPMNWRRVRRLALAMGRTAVGREPR